MDKEEKILDDNFIFNNKDGNWENASILKRYAIGVIDVIMIGFFYTCVVLVVALMYPLISNEAMAGILFISIILYYLIFEYVLKGKTIGKFITKTKVINKEGNPPTIKQVLIRTFARFMPFEFFTILTRKDRTALHDGASETRVIKL